MERTANSHNWHVNVTVSLTISFALAVLMALLWTSTTPLTAYAANLAASGLDNTGATQVVTQDDDEYMDVDKKIVINQKTSGRYQYDAETKTIRLYSLKATKLTINVEEQDFTLELNGESSLERIVFSSNVTVTGSGSITLSDWFDVEEPCALTMKTGTINSNFISCGSLTVKGGTINVHNPEYEGIYVETGDFIMTGGTVSVLNAHSAAIDVDVQHGGKAIIKGGSLTATIKGGFYAVWAPSMSNKPSCLKEIRGLLSPGARFEKDGNIYEVMSAKQETVKLVKYNGKKTANIKKVEYGKINYRVTGIGKGAFNTNAGKKVTKITIESRLSRIEANAFSGTKSLKALIIKKPFFIEKTGKGKSLKLKVRDDCFVAKKAFVNCGKNGGKKLTVKLYSEGVKKNKAGAYKQFLKAKGLPEKAKLKKH